MWRVEYRSRRVRKQAEGLPAAVRAALLFLIDEMERLGPIRGNWPHYGKLGPDRHHCHLKGGRPTYVAVWETDGSTVRLVRITYVGTHEDAPYWQQA